MSDRRTRTLVIGCGNLLRGDDAAGPDAVRVAVPDVRVGAAFVGRVAHEHVLAGRAPASGDAEEPLYLQASAPERKIAP